MSTLSMSYSTLLALGFGAAVTGCATPGTRPSDMSISDHETAAARAEVDVAAEHRAAARTLRDAQTQACTGMPEGERELTAFFRRADIETVEPLYEYVGKVGRVLRGSVISVRPTPGVTAEWLQRSIECHAARLAAIGYEAKEMGLCPFAVKDVNVAVRSGGDRFLVEVRSRDSKIASEVWRRAQSLVSVARN